MALDNQQRTQVWADTMAEMSRRRDQIIMNKSELRAALDGIDGALDLFLMGLNRRGITPEQALRVMRRNIEVRLG